MTEYDLGWHDELERADWFEDSIRAFFGHPKMTGVVSWRLWNETIDDQYHEMVQGPDTSNLKVRRRRRSSSSSSSSSNSSGGSSSNSRSGVVEVVVAEAIVVLMVIISRSRCGGSGGCHIGH